MKETELDLNGPLIKCLCWINDRNSMYYETREWDSCSFLNHVLYTFLVVGLVRLLIGCVCVAFFLAVTGTLGATILESGLKIPVQDPYMASLAVFTGVLVIVVVISIAAMIVGLSIWLRIKYDMYCLKTSSTSTIAVMYRNWREKRCNKIKFK